VVAAVWLTSKALADWFIAFKMGISGKKTYRWMLISQLLDELSLLNCRLFLRNDTFTVLSETSSFLINNNYTWNWVIWIMLGFALINLIFLINQILLIHLHKFIRNTYRWLYRLNRSTFAVSIFKTRISVILIIYRLSSWFWLRV